LPPILFFHYPKFSLFILAINAVLVLKPVKPWPLFRSFFQLWYGIFDLSHNLGPKAQGIFEKENFLCILAMHPHGVIPLHAFLWSGFCDQYLPSLYGVGATTNIAQRLPIVRQISLWLSAGSAGREVIREAMTVKSHNLFILPGGVAEIFLSKRFPHNTNSHKHVIKGKRYGLMKLALQTGAHIIPCYVFGATQLFDQIATFSATQGVSHDNDKQESTLGMWVECLSRKIRGGITFYWGQYYSPLPHAAKLTLVLGDPIAPFPRACMNNYTINRKKRTCATHLNPSNEQVEELLQRYTDSLHLLFEQYKHQAGYGNDVLEII